MTARTWLGRVLGGVLGALAPWCAAAQAVSADADLRLGIENVGLPAGETMGLVGASWLLELGPGLCAGPAVYGAATGQRGGLFVVGAEAAWCTRIAGSPLHLEAGLFVGGGGGGAAPVGGGLMLRPHVDLLWDFGAWRAGVSLSRVSFPSGDIGSTQFGLVVQVPTVFTYLPPGAAASATASGLGLDRVLAVAGAYLPPSGSTGNDGAPLGSHIGLVGWRAERAIAPHFFTGIESNGAASGGAAGYAELLAEVGAEASLADERAILFARVALGMGGGGAVPVGGGLLVKAALGAQWRIAPELGLAVEGGWVRAPTGSFSAPFGSLALRWDLDAPGRAWQAFGGGVETYRGAARKAGAPQDVHNVVFRMDRFIADAAYLTAQVHSAYGGDAGGFAVGLFGVGAQARLEGGWRLGAELLAGAAGGGGVAVGGGAVVQPMVFAALDLTPALSVRLGAGRIMAVDGPLASTAADLTLSVAYGVGR
jgi:hypothetical protein